MIPRFSQHFMGVGDGIDRSHGVKSVKLPNRELSLMNPAAVPTSQGLFKPTKCDA